MGQNIDLGAFSWDISKLEKQIIANRQEMEQFSVVLKMNKKALSDEKKQLQELGVKFAFVKESQKELNQQLKNGTISQERYNSEMEQSAQAVEEIQSKTKQLASAQSIHIKNIIDQENAIKRLRNENAELNKLYSAGRTEIQGNEGAYRDLNKELNALKTEAKNLGAQLLQLSREGKENTEEYALLEKQWQEVSAQADELNNDFKALDKAVGDNQRSVGDYKNSIIDAINELDLINKQSDSLKNSQKELLQEFKKGAITSEEYKNEAIKLENQLKSLNEKAEQVRKTQKELSDEYSKSGKVFEDFREEFQNLGGEITNGLSQIASGNFVEGLALIKNNITGVMLSLRAMTASLLANPMTAVLVGVTAVATGVGLAVKEIFDYNNQVRELNREVEMLANTQGEVTDQLRRQALAISETYGKDFKDAVKEQKELMDDFGLSAEEAFNVYNRGLAQGGAMNEEFGDSIREYGVLFAQNGYSAQDFINILNSGIDLGVYSDKLPDAIKEAGLSLKENTKGTRDALINAFGASFSDEILTKVSSGKMSVKMALEEISKKAIETGLNQQQLAQLTADVFRGAGEDAGGVLKVLEAINHASKLNTESLSEMEVAIMEVAEANSELEQAKENALKSDSIIAFQHAMDDAWKQIKIFWYKGVAGITNSFQVGMDAVKVGVNIIQMSINSIPNSFSKIMRGIMSDFREFASIGQTVGNVFANLFNPNALSANLKTLTDKIANFKSNALSAIGDVRKESSNITQRAIDKVITERKEANKKTQDRAKAEEIIENRKNGNNKITGATGDANAKADADAKKMRDKASADAEKKRNEANKKLQEAEKLAKEEAKRSIEIAREKSKLSVDNAKYELAEYIRINAEKYKDDKRWTDEKLKNQIDYYNEVKRRQLEILAEEERAKNLSIQMKIDEINAKKTLSENDRNEIKNYQEGQKQIQQQFASERAKIEAETNDKIRTDEKTKKEQDLEDEKLSRSIAFQQKIVDLETQNASEYEIKRQHAQNDRDTELTELDQKLADRLISQENYEVQKTLIESQYAQARKEIDKEVENAKLEGFANVFGQMKSVFGEQTALGKASAIAETTINTYKSATSAYSSLAGIPVVGPALGAAAAALAVASGLKSIQKITSVQTPKAQRGMLLKGKSHAQGGIPILTPNGMIEAEGGEVIINKVSSKLFRGLLSDINVAGGGVKFAQGGVVGSRLAGVQKSLKTETPNITLDNDAISQITNAIYSGSQRGLSDLSENNRIAQGANF